MKRSDGKIRIIAMYCWQRMLCGSSMASGRPSHFVKTIATAGPAARPGLPSLAKPWSCAMYEANFIANRSSPVPHRAHASNRTDHQSTICATTCSMAGIDAA